MEMVGITIMEVGMNPHGETRVGSRPGRKTRGLAFLALSLTLAAAGVRIASQAAAGAPGRDVFVIGAAGDIAGDHLPGQNVHRGRFDNVAELALSMNLDRFLVLGDAQHNWGTLEEYLSYYDPIFGRLNDIAAPATGNHDYYASATAEGYFGYFGARAHPPLGYYSFDLGAWHIIAINSQLFHPPLPNNASWGDIYFGPGTPEYEAQIAWLRDDLEKTRSTRIIAFWHHPRTSWTRPLWDLLYAHGADIILNGHQHNYQRWTPMDPAGNADPGGLRQFVVGTGGYYLDPISFLSGNGYDNGEGHASVPPTFEFGQDGDFGLLRLTLRPQSYDYEFVSVSGDILDSGYGIQVD
jgi:hypothetical protein